MQDIGKDLLERVEDIIFNRRPDATERMVEFAASVKGGAAGEQDLAWRAATVEARLSHALVHGVIDFIEPDVEEARLKYPGRSTSSRTADGRMKIVGDLFGAGKMFLPQVVKSARDEEGGGVSRAVHGGRAQRAHGGRRGCRDGVTGQDRHRDRERRRHDIGKNIVGVVLGCNSYEVVDLGVMVPCDRILQTAVDERADLIGLSGLITPSLDEMVFVAKEMERRNIRLPLLIGGATTSKQHTAVKIAPEYGQTTVHVLDASRVVDVVSSLLNDKLRPDFEQGNRELQGRLRDQYSARRERPLLPYEAALKNRLQIDWPHETLPEPSFVGRRVLAKVPLEQIVPYIDWTFFFAAWELKGRFPAILEHPQYGAAARDLYDNARALLDRIIGEQLLTANGVYGFWPAASEDDDIVVYRDREMTGELAGSTCCASEGDRGWKAQPVARRFHRPARQEGPTIWARSRSRPAWARMRSRIDSNGRTTTTTPSS
jgi:5-methyltetrahydrofolate--homocysteine methyltransferase